MLIGNGGLDTLIGGAGADSFTFLLTSDSTVGTARDIIKAFNGLEGDRIDLTAIDANDLLGGDQAFIWRGTAPFSGLQGELRHFVSGPDCIVQGTVTGAAAGFEIKVAGVTSLGAGDFRL